MDVNKMEFEEIKPKSYPTNLLNKDWNNRKCYYRTGFAEFLQMVHNMEVNEDDVWIVTLEKCGTTWMQELVWLVMNDYNFDGAKAEHLEVRAPFLEFDFIVYKNLDRALEPIKRLQSPRHIKSHLPLPLLPKQLWYKKPKVISVYRNPKDAIISRYYHARIVGYEMDKTLEEYVENYLENISSKQLPFDHITEFYALRNEPWLYYTSFERMKMNLRDVIEDVCKFLNRALPNEEQMQQMLKHLSFEEMKNNPKTNLQWTFDQERRQGHFSNYDKHKFVREGKVGGHKERLSPELIAKLDKWMVEQLATYQLSLDDLLLLNDNTID